MARKMVMMLAMFWMFVTLMSLVSASDVSDGDDLPDFIDLTHRLRVNETLYFPLLTEGFNLENVVRSDQALDHGVWTEVNKFNMIVHLGTHMDAPCHFCKDCWRMHEVPFENLRGPAAVINMVEKCNKNPNYELSLDDVKQWEEANGPIPNGAMIMLNTGGQSRWSDWNDFWGADRYNMSTWEFPGISNEVVDYFLKVRDIKGIGADWGLIDNAPARRSKDADIFMYAHQNLLKNNKLIFEYVKDIEKLPPTGYTILVNPLKIYDSCGAPVRMIAMRNPPCSAVGLTGMLELVTISALVLLQHLYF